MGLQAFGVGTDAAGYSKSAAVANFHAFLVEAGFGNHDCCRGILKILSPVDDFLLEAHHGHPLVPGSANRTNFPARPLLLAEAVAVEEMRSHSSSTHISNDCIFISLTVPS